MKNLNKDIVNFWQAQGKELRFYIIESDRAPITVHYHGECDNSNRPNMENIIAFEMSNGITYRLNNINYREPQMLRMIKLKAFI